MFPFDDVIMIKRERIYLQETRHINSYMAIRQVIVDPKLNAHIKVCVCVCVCESMEWNKDWYTLQQFSRGKSFISVEQSVSS